MGELARSIGRAGVDAGGNIVQEVVKGLLAPYVGEDLAVIVGSAAGATTKEVPAFFANVRQDRIHRATLMVETAVNEAGITAGEFLELVGRDERHRHLMHRAVIAGAEAIGEKKVRTLAAALVTGAIANDEAVVDSALVVVEAVRELEAIHLRVLDLLYGLPSNDPRPQTNENIRPWPWRIEQVYGAAANLGQSFDAVIAKLRSLGMVDSFPSGLLDYEDNRIRLTSFGVMCMDHLHRIGYANQ